MANIMRVGGGGKTIPNVFGDGSDGALIAAGNTAWNANGEDTGMIIRNFTSLTIPSGVTVSAGNRNCGMILRVQGDCTIAGTLANRMSPKTLRESDNVDFSMWPLSMLSGAAGDGGAGGQGGGAAYAAASGAGQSGRFYGGGYSGGGSGASSQTMGSSQGGAGGSVNTITTAIGNIFVGGATYEAGAYGGGGGGGYAAGGTGAGANGGNSSQPQASGGGGGAGNYGGGVIILLVGGNLTVSGCIDCAGSNGGDGGGGNGGAGGGGGGGRIFVCHKGVLVNTGTLNVTGGSAGADGGSYVRSQATDGTDGDTSIKTWAEYKAEDIA